jgi:hypothetical protein
MYKTTLILVLIVIKFETAVKQIGAVANYVDVISAKM